MNLILEKIYKIGIVPVVKLDDEKDALPLAAALCRGGLPVAEITFRTSAARGAIEKVTKAYPDMLVGAGTVLTCEQVDSAVEAGAKFIVTPGFNRKVVEHCIEIGVPVTPGCPTSSDIETALELGLDVVKFFPAENLGGLKMIKALSAPYVGVKFMPTGGINSENVKDYLACDKILACGGSWMVKDSLINAGEFDKIEAMTRDAVNSLLSFKFDHMAINCENASKAGGVAELFSHIFGFEKKEIPVSYYCSDEIEVMKSNARGTNGHIAVKTINIDRAVYHLAKRGVKFDYDTAKYTKDGKLSFIYLADEIGGFAVHLC